MEKTVTNSKLYSFLAVLMAVPAIFAGSFYSGTLIYYILFSVVFYFILISIFDKSAPYGYIFLAIMLWLGFWGKLTVHLLFSYDYIEPIGRFKSTPENWDKVLMISVIAGLGLLLGRLLFALVYRRYSRTSSKEFAAVPYWYQENRKLVLAGVALTILGFVIFNLLFGIQQIGLIPRTILIWPLNAVIAWQVSIGGSLLIATLLWWDIALNKSLSKSIYLVLVEGLVSSVSVLSRGMFVFHIVPQIFAIYEQKKGVRPSIKHYIFLVVLVTTFLLSISFVSVLRDAVYPNINRLTDSEIQTRLIRIEVIDGAVARIRRLIKQGEPHQAELQSLILEKQRLEQEIKEDIFQKTGHFDDQTAIAAHNSSTKEGEEIKNSEIKNSEIKNSEIKNSEIKNSEIKAAEIESEDIKREVLENFMSNLQHRVLPKILSLSIDRWIGLEGVMAVSSYPYKDMNLFREAFSEKREIGKNSRYQEICNSHYQWTDPFKFQFASLPGIVGFLFFSGSLLVVFLGMVLFVVVLQLSEKLIMFLTLNPLLAAIIGFSLANTIAQFGVAPRQVIPFYIMVFGYFVFVFVIQSISSIKNK